MQPRTWNEEFWQTALSWTTAVCVEHRGEHAWVEMSAPEGVCLEVGSGLVPVTARCIKWGQRGRADSCPVAYAVRAALPTFYGVSVFTDRVTTYIAGVGMVSIPLPAGVTARIREYDESGEMEPFVFQMPAIAIRYSS